MATVDKPLPRQEQSSIPGTMRPLVRPPKPFFLRSWFALVLMVAVIAAHVVGWEVAQIDPPTLVEKWPELQRRLGELLQPDVISQDQKQLQVSLPVVGVDTPPAQTVPATIETATTAIIKRAGNPENTQTEGADLETFNVTLTISTDQGAPGQKITVTGEGFRPSTAGKILWQSTGTNAYTQPLGPFAADANGNFTTEVQVPGNPGDVVNSFGFPNTLFAVQDWNFGNLYFSDTLGLVLEKMGETIFLALMATTFAIFVALPLSFFAARNLMPKTFWGTAIYTLARTVLNILRSIESLILAVIFAATVGLGPFAGVLALMVYAIASLGKFYSEAIEAIDPGPLEAITATGANRIQVIQYGVIPQFIPQFIAFTLYMWDRNVRASTIIGFVGGGGVGFILQQFINLGDFHKAATAIWAIAIVVIAMDWVSARVRAKVI
ncbi:MAG: phosphonate ABC transporter, permease protein PhnE [Chloroflexia bacterium]